MSTPKYKRTGLLRITLAMSVLFSTLLFGGVQADDQPPTGGPPNTSVYLPLITSTNADASTTALEEQALALVATRQQLTMDDLTVASSSSSTFPAQGITAFVFQVMDVRDETIYDIVLDQHGQELDLAQIEASEQAQVNASAQVDAAKANAIAHIAAQQGIPQDQLRVVEQTTSQLLLTGVKLADYKAVSRDGRVFGVSFDLATGQVADPIAAAQQEQQARSASYGAIEATLHARLQRNAAERIPVAIWVALENPGALARGETPNFTTLGNRVSVAQAPVADAVRGVGGAPEQADLVPVIFAELNAGQINGLSRHPNILAIEEIPQNLARHNDDSATSDRYPFIWSSASGAGTIIAVHEDDGVDTANTFLLNPTYWCSGVNAGPGGTACNIGTNIGSHATNVAGVIASTHQWRRGGAFGISQIQSANFQSFGSATKIVNSAAWAIANSADTINMSWGSICSGGSPNFYSRWADYLVRTTGVNIVVSAGNSTCPSGTPQYVGAPSLGWNTISVGSYWDRDTGLRSDDVLSSFTSFVNPTDPNSGRTYEKPDVAAMGGQVDGSGCHGTETTGVGGGVTDVTCGTSFAAPDTAALTALVVGKNPAGLRRNAEAVKAIIMAGATHNIIDGLNYANCPSSPTAHDCRDGAGAIDAFQTIQNIVVPGNWRFPGFITPASFDASGNINYTTNFVAGRKVRVVIAWDSTAVCSSLGTGSQACNSDVLNADLDLIVLNPNGTTAAASTSYQNSAEVVDFTAGTTGTYTIRINRFRFDANTDTYLGVAWNPNIADSRNPLVGVTNFTLNTTRTGQTTDKGRSFWDTYSGPAAGCSTFLSNETGLEKVYQVTTTQTGRINASLASISGYTGVNSDIDVIILRKSGAANTQNSQTIACGDASASALNQPAGTYYIVVDGFNGSVARFSLTVNFVAGAAAAGEAEVLPQR